MMTTFNFRGIEFKVNYEYDPPSIGDELTPSFDEEIRINSIWHNKTDFTDFFLNQDPNDEFFNAFVNQN